jgi:hypothetical protein
MKRAQHPVLLCLAIIIAAALVDTAVAKWVWHGTEPIWFHSLFTFVIVMLPVQFIVRPFLSPDPTKPDA